MATATATTGQRVLPWKAALQTWARPTASGPRVNNPVRTGNAWHIRRNDGWSCVTIKRGLRFDRQNGFGQAGRSASAGFGRLLTRGGWRRSGIAVHLLLLGHPPSLGRCARGHSLGDARLLRTAALDHLVGEDEPEFHVRDEPARPLGLCFVSRLVLALPPARRLLEEEDPRVGRFEVATLDRRTVFTDYLHGETPAGDSPRERISTAELVAFVRPGIVRLPPE